MPNSARIPTWWYALPGATFQDLRELFDAVTRADVSRNDKRTVERLWHERQIMRALRKPPDEPQNPVD